MSIDSFLLERYFARYEFSARWLLSPSDCESLSMQELLGLADAETGALWAGLRLGYTESQGHPLLRAEIARLYQQIQPENVLVAAPEEAILIAMNVLLRPADRVVVVWPAYQSLYEVARSIGCEVTPWPLEIQPGEAGKPPRWKANLERLEPILAGARLLVLNFPHNPTGYLPDEATFREILAAAQRAGVVVFSDEMYRGLQHAPAAGLPAGCDLGDQVVSLAGLSKPYGLAGLRMGWLATQNADWLARFQAYKDYTTICASAPGEILAIAALRAGDAILARNQAVVAHNLRLAEEFFTGRPQWFEWIRPEGGSTAFPRWVGGGRVEDFCRAAVEGRGVMVVPAGLFEAQGNHFRVGLGRTNFGEVLQELDHFLLEWTPTISRQ